MKQLPTIEADVNRASELLASLDPNDISESAKQKLGIAMAYIALAPSDKHHYLQLASLGR